jgi:sugar/nucleoside kinase (ribokinase family)
MAKGYDVYGVGAALVDTEINVSDDDLVKMGVEKGLMTLVDKEREKYLFDCLAGNLVHSKRTSGGSTANAIIGIAQFGGRTFYSCKVGNDDNGNFYLDDLQTAGVGCHVDKRDDNGNTDTCLVMITPDAERTLCTFLGINANLSADDIDPEIIAASKYVYFEAYMVMSPISLAAAIRTRQIAEEKGVKIALSFSDPGIVKY